MNKPAFLNKYVGWINFKSARQAECERERKEVPTKESTIVVPINRDEFKQAYLPKPLPDVKLTWPTKSGKTEADARRICGNAIRNSAPGKLCSNVAEVDFEIYIKMCVIDIQVCANCFICHIGKGYLLDLLNGIAYVALPHYHSSEVYAPSRNLFLSNSK